MNVPDLGPKLAIPSIANLDEVIQGKNARTFKQTITMDDGKQFVVTIRYPEGNDISLEKAKVDLAAQVEKMVKYAIKLGLGNEGLKKIQVTNTGVFGVWTGAEGKKDFKDFLNTQLTAAQQAGDKQKEDEIIYKLKTINKTVNFFNSTFPSAKKPDEPTSKKDSKKVAKPITQPSTPPQPIVQPVDQPSTKPIVQPITQPPITSISQPSTKPITQPITTNKPITTNLQRYKNKGGVDFNAPVKVTDNKGNFVVVDHKGANRAHITWFFLTTKKLNATQQNDVHNHAEKIFNDYVVEYFTSKGQTSGPYELSWDDTSRKPWGNSGIGASMLCGGQAEEFKQGLHQKLKSDPIIKPYLSERGAAKNSGMAAPAHIDLGSNANLQNVQNLTMPLKFRV